jgi:hypothetical protein
VCEAGGGGDGEGGVCGAVRDADAHVGPGRHVERKGGLFDSGQQQSRRRGKAGGSCGGGVGVGFVCGGSGSGLRQEGSKAAAEAVDRAERIEQWL